LRQSNSPIFVPLGVKTAASSAFALNLVGGGDDMTACENDGEAPGVNAADSTLSFFLDDLKGQDLDQ